MDLLSSTFGGWSFDSIAFNDVYIVTCENPLYYIGLNTCTVRDISNPQTIVSQKQVNLGYGIKVV